MQNPTPEQCSVINTWKRGINQVVSAAAGAGKSTVLLHCVQAAPPGSRVVLLSYNRPLARELQDKIDRMTLEKVTARAYTFHGLCSVLYSLTPDDVTMEDVLEAAKKGRVKRADFSPTHVCIDECQDMRPIHHDLIKTVLGGLSPIFLLVGDIQQLLYSFETPPATTEYMLSPELHFGGQSAWERHSLTTSFRLHSKNANLVNAVSEQMDGKALRAGNEIESPPAPQIRSVSVWQWGNDVVELIHSLVKRHGCANIGVISRSVRNSVPLLGVVNLLAKKGVSVYIHGVDGADEKVREGKLCVTTWHASKGLQWKVVVVLGVDGLSERNALHVALTRSTTELYVFNDAQNPCAALLRALASGVEAYVDDCTAVIGRKVDSLSPALRFVSSGAKDVTAWTARGGLAHRLHALIIDAGGVDPDDSDLDASIIVNIGGTWEEVTELYVSAVLMAAEAGLIGGVQRCKEMLSPPRGTRDYRLKRLMSGDRRRIVDQRKVDSELLPDNMWAALSDVANAGANASAVSYARAAVADASFNGFHHRVSRLHTGKWISALLLNAMLKIAISALPKDTSELTFDAVCSRPADEAGRPIYARFAAVNRGTNCAYHFVFCERITASARLKAVLPLAIDDKLQTARLVNLRTGEIQNLGLENREDFLKHMQE